MSGSEEVGSPMEHGELEPSPDHTETQQEDDVMEDRQEQEEALYIKPPQAKVIKKDKHKHKHKEHRKKDRDKDQGKHRDRSRGSRQDRHGKEHRRDRSGEKSRDKKEHSRDEKRREDRIRDKDNRPHSRETKPERIIEKVPVERSERRPSKEKTESVKPTKERDLREKLEARSKESRDKEKLKSDSSKRAVKVDDNKTVDIKTKSRHRQEPDIVDITQEKHSEPKPQTEKEKREESRRERERLERIEREKQMRDRLMRAQREKRQQEEELRARAEKSAKDAAIKKEKEELRRAREARDNSRKQKDRSEVERSRSRERDTRTRDTRDRGDRDRGRDRDQIRERDQSARDRDRERGQLRDQRDQMRDRDPDRPSSRRSTPQNNSGRSKAPPEPIYKEESPEVEEEVESSEAESEDQNAESASEEESGDTNSEDSDSDSESESGSESGEEDEQKAPVKSKFEDQSEEEASEEEHSPEPQGHYLDDTPPQSPIELKPELPPYFPAIQGCRSVEEFHCLNRIEEGTYGVVYRARDKKTNEIVALKRLKMEKEKEGFPITSLREISTILKGQHENIVTVREIVVGSNMDKIYIVMDYVEHDLKSLMESMKQPFLVGEVKTLMLQLLRAVNHLHDNWILHRDLKTSNLLLSHKGILKVGDFGLAREYGSPLKPYTPIVVTLWYRAPELLLGTKQYDTAIDVWSVGCIFAEFLTMKPLFPGKSEIDELNRIFKDLGTPNEKIWPGVGDLPTMKKCTFAEYPYNTLRNRFGSYLTEKGFELVNKFLTYDPKKRIKAQDALKHEFFKESPQPVDPSMFPTWPAKSEQNRKHGNTPKPPSGGKGAYAKLLGDDDIEQVLATGGAGFHLQTATKGISSGAVPSFSLKF
ncbi:unnamed protein product [Owenia fusiformis]|uniref:cyclin-dependent kinase n=1 Tax=Owenia fusiformis TaxID=6347 RepID=A0A8S4N368_OWEFU|nr:unnamed protein product [Owenia fusiformis]